MPHKSNGEAAKPISMPATINSTALENLSGITERRLRQLADAGKIPQPKDGLWPTAETIRGLVTHYRTTRTGAPIESAKLAKLEAETKLLQMRAAQEIREWIPAALVESVWGKIVTELRQKITFLEIPDEKKKEILEDMQSIPVDDYFPTANQNDSDESAQDNEEAITTP